jgi:hypothetical protein
MKTENDYYELERERDGFIYFCKFSFSQQILDASIEPCEIN